jgi:hypothetical protein
VQGIETPKNVELAEIVDCKSKEDLLLSVIEKHLISLFYASPSLQFDYLGQVTGVEVKTATRDSWIELKAARDLIVHNSGIINEIYLKKCGKLGRAS